MDIYSDFSNIQNQYMDISGQALERFGQNAPFLKLLMKLRRENADNSKWTWTPRDLPKRVCELAEDLDDSETEITLTDSDGIVGGDLLMLRTNLAYEVMFVESNNTGTDTVTVTRAFAGTAATASTGDNLRIMSDVHPEGSAPSTEVHSWDEYWNYIQDFSSLCTISHKAMLEKVRVNDWPQKKKDTLREHMDDIEGALFFGERATGTIDSEDYMSTRGLYRWAAAADAISGSGIDNVYQVASLSLSNFRNFQLACSRYNSGQIVMFLGETLLKKIRELFDDTWMTADYAANGITDMPILRTTTFTGREMIFIPHDIFQDSEADLGIACDLNKLKLKVLQNTSITSPDYGENTKAGYEIVTRCGLEVTEPLSVVSLEVTG